ncbi:helix-turn-helix domain-containing protein [Nocardioides secundeburneus]
MVVPYPSRPTLEPLARFRGSATIKPSPHQRAEFVAFVVSGYQAGRSLRQIAELTDRTQTAVRRALDQAGIPRRARGAARLGGPH